MNQLSLLISSQEEQEKKGNLTKTGISYLNGLRTAMNIVNESQDAQSNYIRLDGTYGKVWVMFDLDNGHVATNGKSRGYMWVFATKKLAMSHRKKQHSKKFGAKLSMPIKVEMGNIGQLKKG
jgi:hypothetical protein